jgi:hypothetical protein
VAVAILGALVVIGPPFVAAVAATRRPCLAWSAANRVAWLFVCVMAMVSIAWLFTMPRQHSEDWTPYHNDAIALNECAARLLLSGTDPYASLDIFDCYRGIAIGADRTTPLARGLFEGVAVYPTDDQLDEAWTLREREGGNVEFVTRPSYPALSFLLLVPFVAVGLDTNYVYVACLLAAMALIVWRSPSGLRPFVLTGLLGAPCLAAFTVGGSADLLYALPLVVAWLWRDRLRGAVAFGIAASVKQLAWFVWPFYVIAVAGTQGWRAALRHSVAAAAVFAVTNLPFVLWHPGDWLAGILTPVVEPMFPGRLRSVFPATNGPLPLLPSTAIGDRGRHDVPGARWRTRRVLFPRSASRSHSSRCSSRGAASSRTSSSYPLRVRGLVRLPVATRRRARWARSRCSRCRRSCAEITRGERAPEPPASAVARRDRSRRLRGQRRLAAAARARLVVALAAGRRPRPAN